MPAGCQQYNVDAHRRAGRERPVNMARLLLTDRSCGSQAPPLSSRRVVKCPMWAYVGGMLLSDIFHAPLRALQAYRHTLLDQRNARAELRSKGLCETCGAPSPDNNECLQCWVDGRAP